VLTFYNVIKADPFGMIVQGTWQFMSARMIAQMEGPHIFVDDLESSLYVLLWMVLMYSECSDSMQVPTFLQLVLDPQSHLSTGGYGKADFLKGRTFLTQVNFPHRPALHQLIVRLAELFAVRYEQAPTESERTEFALLMTLKDSPEPIIFNIHTKSTIFLFDQQVTALENHLATISLFENALRDSLQWLASDHANKQHFTVEKPPPTLMMKTGWSTTLVI
jgi:hypothetical protein